METNNVQITLKGASFRDCIAQAKELVVEAEKFGGTVTTGTTATTGKRTRKTAAPAATEETLDMTASDDTDTLTDTTTDESELSFDAAEEVEETTTISAKGTKAAKITDKDVNTAAMAHAKKHGRPKTLEILSKKFKVKSILELKPDQYADVLKALKV